MAPTLDDDLALAQQLADAADVITLGRFRSHDLVVDTKPDMTPVSEADRLVEETLRKVLAAERPGDGVVGEELPDTDPTATRRWIVDPIDGTKGYVRGLPVWATLIALEVDGELVLGLASAPALGSRWWATRDGGAFRDGEPIGVSAVHELADAHLAYDSVGSFDAAGLTDEFLSLSRRCWRSRGFGDFWQHVLVAEGAVDVALDPYGLKIYDLAAPLVIVEEAGGRFTDLTGAGRADGGSAVATNGRLHDAVLDALGTRA